MRKERAIIIHVKCLDAQSHKDTCARVQRWLEAFGHTACSFGFDFTAVNTARIIEAEEDTDASA